MTTFPWFLCCWSIHTLLVESSLIYIYTHLHIYIYIHVYGYGWFCSSWGYLHPSRKWYTHEDLTCTPERWGPRRWWVFKIRPWFSRCCWERRLLKPDTKTKNTETSGYPMDPWCFNGNQKESIVISWWFHVNSQFASLNMAIEIVDLPNNWTCWFSSSLF
jgi:hypothetical protein